MRFFELAAIFCPVPLNLSLYSGLFSSAEGEPEPDEASGAVLGDRPTCWQHINFVACWVPLHSRY